MRRPGTAVSCPVALVAPARIVVMGHFCNLRRSGKTLGCRGGQVVDGQPDGWDVAAGQGTGVRTTATGSRRFITIQGRFYRDPVAVLSRSRASNGAWHGFRAPILAILVPRLSRTLNRQTTNLAFSTAYDTRD